MPQHGHHAESDAPTASGVGHVTTQPAPQAAHAHEGSPTAVLVIHGFTSRPASIMPWADALRAAGHPVKTPLLPGHGTHWHDLESLPYTAWTRAVEVAYDSLAARHGSVAVAGLSMGGTLALHLAAVRRPVAVLVTNPALSPYPWYARFAPALRHVVRSTSGIADDIARPGVSEGAYERTPTAAVAQLIRLEASVRRELPGIAAPITLFRSATDHVVSDASVDALRSGLTTATRARLREVPLPRSLHVATLDWDAGIIADGSVSALAEARTGALP